MLDLFELLFKRHTAYGTNGECWDGKYYPNKGAVAPFDKPGYCGAGSYTPYDAVNKTSRASSESSPGSTSGGYVDPATGMWVPDSAVPTKAQMDAAPSWAGGPPRPMQSDGYQPSAAAAKQVYDAPANMLPAVGPMPPQRPQDTPGQVSTALQRYNAATQPATFGSTAPLPPTRPEEAGPPMPSPEQMAQMQGQQPQPLGVPGHSAISDPSSAQNFWGQQQPGSQGAGGSGPSSMDALMAQHQADNDGFQQRARAMLAVHQAATQAQWQRMQSASRQSQLQAAQDNPGAAEGLQRIFDIQDRTAGSF